MVKQTKKKKSETALKKNKIKKNKTVSHSKTKINTHACILKILQSSQLRKSIEKNMPTKLIIWQTSEYKYCSFIN